MTALKNGYEVFFAGKESDSYTGSFFSKILKIGWGSLTKLGNSEHWNLVKKQIGEAIEEVRPDIIHAHNIYSAKMASEFELPFVYDDHEYWSKHIILIRRRRTKSLSVKTLKNELDRYYMARLYPAWEEELVSSVPVIVTSGAVIDDFSEMYHSDRLFLVPNYPTLHEVRDLQSPRRHSELTSIYAGADNFENMGMHRNIRGFPEVFEANDIGNLAMIGPKGESSAKVRYTGFVKRDQMYLEMANGSIGMLPWQSHWLHKYASPNKVYEYAHAGLFVMCTSSFETVANTLKENCVTFDDYDSLVSQLNDMKSDMEELYNKRLKIFEFARSKLIWENNEKHILAAYQAC